MEKVKILIISDLHLGSSLCKTDVLLEVLQKYAYEMLVIVGDLFDEKDLELQKGQFEIIEHLHENRKKIKCTDGNHDRKEDGLVKKMLGINVQKECSFEIADKKFLALHGHRFDKLCFIFDEPLIDKIFNFITRFLKTAHIKGYGLKNWFDNFHKGFALRLAKKAATYANKKGQDVVICGHTHQPSHIPFQFKYGRTVEYFNCGDWVESCSFITVNEDGNATLHFVPSKL